MIEFDELKDFENKHNLFYRRYNGVNYWQMIRLNLVSGNENESTEKKVRDHKRGVLWQNIRYCIKNIIADSVHIRSKKECDILYFDQCSYSYVDGEWKDTYFDYFEIEKEYKVNRCYYLRKKISKFGIGVAIPLTKYYFFRMLAKLNKKIGRDEKEIEQIKKIDVALSRRGNNVLVEHQVKNAYFLFKAYKPFYDQLLKNWNPKAVFIVCHYDETLFPLYQACKEKGVPVIELQHGLASGVYGYSYKDRTDVGKQLPSHIFTYGDIWDSYIKMPSTTKVISVGNAFLENRKEKYSNVEIDYKKVIIYSFPDERGRLIDLAIYVAKTMSEYQIMLKLHPRELQFFDEIENRIKDIDNLEIVDKKTELYELLSSAGHHIAISSTVLYEASIYDSRRYVYSRPIYVERMQPLIDAGLAIPFNEVEEIPRLIMDGKEKITTIENKNLMWKLNASLNARTALRKILSSQL